MRKFLIIDDDKSLWRLYEILISKKYADASIDYALNGREGLTKIKLSNYSVIISDIIMPEMDGIAFYKKLREFYPHLKDKVCFTSASSCHIQSFLVNEGCLNLLKPFKIQDFYHMVDNILQLKKEGSKSLSSFHPERIKRYNIKESGVLKPVSPKQSFSQNITAEIISYSENGLGLKYPGEKLDSGIQVDISVGALNIYNKRAEIIWSKQLNGETQAGLFWIQN